MNSDIIPENECTFNTNDSFPQTLEQTLSNGDALFARGEFIKALEVYKHCLNLAQTLPSNDVKVDMVALHYKLGKASYSYELYSEAGDYYTKALELANKNAEDAKNKSIIQNLNLCLGEVLSLQGNHPEAYAQFKALLDVTEKVRDPDTEVINATCYLDLAKLHCYGGQYNQAMENVEQAIQIFSQHALVSQEQLASSYDLLAELKTLLGKYVEALKAAQKSLNIRENYFKGSHPTMVESYAILGNICVKEGKHMEGLKYFQRALDLKKKYVGEYHFSLSRCYNNIGVAYSDLNDNQKALENYTLALKIDEASYGKDHINIAYRYINLAALYWDSEEYNQALSYYDQALEIQITTFGEEHPEIADTYNNMGNVCQRMHNYDLAQDYIKKALAMNIKTLGGDHPQVADSYHILGTLYLKQDEYYESVSNLIHSLKIRNKIFERKNFAGSRVHLTLKTIFEINNDLERASDNIDKISLVSRVQQEKNESAVARYKSYQEVFEQKRCRVDLNHDSVF